MIRQLGIIFWSLVAGPPGDLADQMIGQRAAAGRASPIATTFLVRTEIK